jgi:hypothetical protein
MPIILFISTDVFSNGPFTIDAMAAISQRSHTHSLSLSLSLCLSASLPIPLLIPFDIKTLASILSLLIE